MAELEIPSPPRPADEAVAMSRADSEATHEADRQFTRISRQLYISHFMSTWNFRSFEFGAVLFLASIYPGTLAPLSIYAVIRSLAPILLGSQVGRYIDEKPRLRVVRTSIVGQRGAVVVSCVLFLLLITFQEMPSFLNHIVFGVSILIACVEKLCAIMNTVAVERDWVVEIAGKSEADLREMNSQMRRIDLFCKLAGPLAIAFIDGFDSRMAIGAVLVTNAASVSVEYILIANVYRIVPALARSKPSASEQSEAAEEMLPLTENGTDIDQEDSSEQTTLRAFLDTMTIGIATFWTHLHVYISQSAFLPSLALSILYLTVLSFGGQMVTYLLAAGYTSTMIGLIRVGSTAFELSATWVAPRAMQKIGPVRAGIWFLSWQTSCLAVSVLLFWRLANPLWAATGLVAGTILSRVGLWGFDLCAQVLIQDEVEAHARGSFSTTEAALQNFFELMAYLSTIIFWQPSQFKFPVALSVVAVFVASAVYARFVRSRRGHLLHFSKCVEGRQRHQYHHVNGYSGIIELHNIDRQPSSPH